MTRAKVLVVLGTRPEGIKLAPVIKEIQIQNSRFDLHICSTGQHREMLDQVLSVFCIQPNTDFRLMLPGQNLSHFMSEALSRLTNTVAELRPDIMLVQGDTATALVGAMAGFYNQVAVGHIEAGLRTHNKWSPFPEEMNRRLISCLSTYHFVPTQRAFRALKAEGIVENKIFLTGNTIIDALFLVLSQDSNETRYIPSGKKGLLVTCHRRENFGGPLENICIALKMIAERNPEIEIVFPVHLNPSVRKTVHQILSGHKTICNQTS